jgi:hypothetical protein
VTVETFVVLRHEIIEGIENIVSRFDEAGKNDQRPLPE